MKEWQGKNAVPSWHAKGFRSATTVLVCVLVLMSSSCGIRPESDRVEDTSLDSYEEITAESGPHTVSGEIPLRLAQVLKSPSRYHRTVALYDLLRGADEDSLVQIARRATSLPSRRDIHFVQDAVFRKLSSTDPLRAIELLEANFNTDRDHMIRAVFGEWASSNLDTAIIHAANLSEHERLLVMYEVMQSQPYLVLERLKNIAKQLKVEWEFDNWNSAFKQLEYIEDPRSHWFSVVSEDAFDESYQENLVRAATHWVRVGGTDVLQEIGASIEESGIRHTVLVDTLRSVVEYDAETAFEMASSLHGIDNANAMSAIAVEWGLLDPHGALQRIEKISESDRKLSLQRSVVRVWAHKNTIDFLENMNSVPDNLQSWGQQLALEAVLRQDPEVAATRLGEVNDSATRITIARKVALEWSRYDAFDALEWVLANADTAADLQTLGAVLGNLSIKDPNLALEKALEQPTSKSSVGAETFVIAKVLTMDVDKAIAMVPHLRENSKPLSYRFIAYQLIQNGEANRAIEFGETIPSDSRKDYFVYLFGQWNQEDRTSLLENLNGFARDDVKSYAAKVLDFENKRNGILSDEELRMVESLLDERNYSDISASQISLATLPPHYTLAAQGRGKLE